MASLVDSIKAVGILQPVLVRETTDGDFELIAGERRFRAAHRAGLATVPALIRGADDAASLEQALVENLHREDLNALDEAGAYQQLIEDFGLTHDDVAKRVGKSRAAVTNALRLFQLPPTVQRYVRDGLLSAGHGRALLATPDRASQEELGRAAAAAGLSVRALEERVRAAMQADGALPRLEDEPPSSTSGGSMNGQPSGAGERQPARIDEADGSGSTGHWATDATGPGSTGPGGSRGGRTTETAPGTAGSNSSLDLEAPAHVQGDRLRPPGVLDLEELLGDHLNTRVSVDVGGKRGRVIIEFANLDDLERIYRVMIGEG